MTNAEKYTEVFGIEPDTIACPTKLCENCPNNDPKHSRGPFNCGNHFWTDEYKEPTNASD